MTRFALQDDDRPARREFLRRTALGLGSLAAFASRTYGIDAKAMPAGDIERIEHLGPYISSCSLPGETKADGISPRHANCIQVAASRWLVLYSTHGYRGVDDERSIVYQLRADAPDGPIVREGFFARAIDDWRPPGLSPAPAGYNYFKQHGHMTAFGVPKGARIEGRSVPHANRFVAKWRTLGRPLETARNYLHKAPKVGELVDRTRYVEWVQFRLNEAEDDIEILEPVQRLRQQGFETGAKFTSLDVAWMNQSYCPAVPLDARRDVWLDCNSFDGDRLAVLQYRFDPATDRYVWTNVSALIGTTASKMHEASLVRCDDGWLIAARTEGKVAWSRAAEPLGPWSTPTFGDEPFIAAPLTVFRCADDVLRLFTGDPKISPHRNGRDPLYCWDVQPTFDGATTSERRMLFDSVAAGLPLRVVVRPKLDFCELFPHVGRTQLIVHGVSTRAYDHPYENRNDIPPVTAAEKRVLGLYSARITYRREPPPLWQF
jgi:hypothetical protein